MFTVIHVSSISVFQNNFYASLIALDRTCMVRTYFLMFLLSTNFFWYVDSKKF